MQSNDPSLTSAPRVFPASPKELFAAFERPELLARWWGPSGFTNTFELFEFQPGGRWVFVMHGPDGVNYANESVFREIAALAKIVIEPGNLSPISCVCVDTPARKLSE